MAYLAAAGGLDTSVAHPAPYTTSRHFGSYSPAAESGASAAT